MGANNNQNRPQGRGMQNLMQAGASAAGMLGNKQQQPMQKYESQMGPAQEGLGPKQLPGMMQQFGNQISGMMNAGALPPKPEPPRDYQEQQGPVPKDPQQSLRDIVMAKQQFMQQPPPQQFQQQPAPQQPIQQALPQQMGPPPQQPSFGPMQGNGPMQGGGIGPSMGGQMMQQRFQQRPRPQNPYQMNRGRPFGGQQ